MISLILVDFLPIIAAVIYAIVYFNSKKKVAEKFNEEEKQTLQTVKKKTIVVRIILIVLFIILYCILTFLEVRNPYIDLMNNTQTSLMNNPYGDLNNIYSIFFGVQKYILLMLVLTTLSTDLYVRFVHKLDDKEKEVAQKYYSGKTIMGIIFAILMIIYVFFIKFVLSV